jgi:CRISPR-associated protein Csy3
MHSQKIGNALRTIDTWYEEFSENNYNPIPIEAYGAVTNLGKAFRHPTRYKDSKLDFYTLFDRFSMGYDLKNIDEKNYVMAVLVRGGVFGVNKDEVEKDKKSKSKNSSEE